MGREVEPDATDEDVEQYISCIYEYRRELKIGMQTDCIKALAVIESDILPFALDIGNHVLFNKMAGDMYSLLHMIKGEGDDGLCMEKALLSYKTAYDGSMMLPPADPHRLCAVLNLSALCFDTNKKERALEIATMALKDVNVAELSEQGFIIFQLIQENVQKWLSAISNSSENGGQLEEVTQDEAHLSQQKACLGKEHEQEQEAAVKSKNKEESGAEVKQEPAKAEEENGTGSVTINGDGVADREDEEQDHEVENNEDEVEKSEVANRKSHFKCPYSPGPPSPVRRYSVPPLKQHDFVELEDWGHEKHVGISHKELRRRRKASQIRKGMMG